ncbi:MAG TPA: dihydroorotate dehydrogenase electron transfer subunit [Gemmatimonadota bacterium]|nr:dihydroorotate dehydrogenase electron transfer subunit [Gemmatimonadota bacterium]
MARPLRRRARVLSNAQTAAGTWWLELEAPEFAAAARPGQFLMIGFGLDHLDAPFLPRPFSIGWRGSDGRIGLLVREFGGGTRRLGALRRGESVLLLGPLGRPFSIPADRRLVCVAGGVGLAPFLFLVPEALRGGADVSLLYGERSADRVFDPDLIERLTGLRAELFTEDGSAGRAGLVLDGIDTVDRPALFGCGPTPMLRALERLADDADLDLEVSVEEHMGCGVGTCQGCVVRSADGRWVKSCTEGPVFERRELAWPR